MVDPVHTVSTLQTVCCLNCIPVYGIQLYTNFKTKLRIGSGLALNWISWHQRVHMSLHVDRIVTKSSPKSENDMLTDSSVDQNTAEEPRARLPNYE